MRLKISRPFKTSNGSYLKGKSRPGMITSASPPVIRTFLFLAMLNFLLYFLTREFIIKENPSRSPLVMLVSVVVGINFFVFLNFICLGSSAHLEKTPNVEPRPEGLSHLGKHYL